MGPIAEFSEMRDVAAKYFDAQLNDDRSKEKLNKIFSRYLIFFGNIQCVDDRSEILRRFEMNLKNIVKVEKRSEEYRESKGLPNRLICKVRSTQQRQGLGFGEENKAGNFKIFVREVICVEYENGAWKIKSIQQTKHTKTRLQT